MGSGEQNTYVPVEMTDELRTKMSAVCKNFLAHCRHLGMTDMESLMATAFVQQALQEHLGVECHGIAIVNDGEMGTA